jgi:hypothetical protein
MSRSGSSYKHAGSIFISSTDVINPRIAIEAKRSILEILANSPHIVREYTRWVGERQDYQRVDSLIPDLKRVVTHSDLILWDTNVMKAAQNGNELYVDTVFEKGENEFIPQLWITDSWKHLGNDHDSIKAFNLDRECTLIATCLFKVHGIDTNQGGISIALFFMPVFNEVHLPDKPEDMCCRIRLLPPIAYGRKLVEPYNLYVSMYEFLQLPFISLEEPRMKRAERRRLERDNHGKMPKLRVIQLRRAQHKDTGSNDSEEAKWHYRCKFLVAGHRQKYHYGQNREHTRIVWKSPYMKGDADAPFKPSGEKVYVAKR